MSGRSEGFTLLEVVVALSVVAVAFIVLLEVLSYLGREMEKSERTLSDLITLDRKVKEGDLEGLRVERIEVPEYPVVRGVVYRIGNLFLVRYERK